MPLAELLHSTKGPESGQSGSGGLRPCWKFFGAEEAGNNAEASRATHQIGGAESLRSQSR